MVFILCSIREACYWIKAHTSIKAKTGENNLFKVDHFDFLDLQLKKTALKNQY